MNHLESSKSDPVVDVLNADAQSSVVVVCEHASAHIPVEFDGLGLAEGDRLSHAAWDPGALAVAQGMARKMDALLLAARTSRLVYDCNRPPGARDAMPAQSEVIEVPGNRNLTEGQKAQRVAAYYTPFEQAVARALQKKVAPVLVTIHSFTPVYHGQTREVEIGVLHDTDARLADAMMACADDLAPLVVRRNEPYGMQDGVTHTLKEHALPQGRLNVMLEIRNDLIVDAASQTAMAARLAAWVTRALAQVKAKTC